MPRTSSKAPQGGSAQGPAWSIPNLREPRYSQSLERGLAILSSFTAERPVLGVVEIADELEMSRSTAHRYVITLVALGYLEQDASRKYRLGLGVTDLGMSALNSTGLREHAVPYLHELRQRTSYTVSLGVLDGSDVLYVDQARSFRRGHGVAEGDARTGSRLPAHCNAMGKLLLANLPDAEQTTLIAQLKLAKHGPNTITSKSVLREELDEVRRTNVAVDVEEHARDLCSIAAPVRDESSQVVAAVDIAVPSALITRGELVDALGPHLISTGDRASARLGHRRPHERHP
jgi:IclR family transcriptional regulator, pca regulon regulatory protein